MLILYFYDFVIMGKFIKLLVLACTQMKYLQRKNLYPPLISLCLLAIGSGCLIAQEDKAHFSKVFNREKPYRIFLPSDYYTSQKRYPVIYYFHGNTGNHELNIPGVKQLVKENGVILVAWNGRSVDSDLRPYNIGNHSNINYQVQFKDYFLEFINCIDSTYRTLPDRSHRALIGHSMGGIMSFFIAGKYPDLVGTAYSSKGSPEFFIGYPSQHSLYHIRHMFKNLYGVRLGFATSTECELYYLNNEVISGALRETGLDFSFKKYEGSHSITQEQFRDAFNFVIASFINPLPDPVRWHHADLYPNFDIWGYEIRSNLNKRGFIDMEGVTKGGLGIGTKGWEPDGGTIPGIQINVKTPSIYLPKTFYTFLDFNGTKDEVSISTVMSDEAGKISFTVNHEKHQIGICRNNDPAEITLAAYKVNNQGLFLDHKKGCSIAIRLLNRGGSEARNISVTLDTPTEGITITSPTIGLDRISSGELIWMPAEFKVIAANKPPMDGSPFRIRFNLTVTDNKNHTWNDEFDAPVYFDVPEFTRIGIDDGDSEIFGSGNGNNIAEPGETVMIYEISNGSRRLRLYYDDPWIDSERLYDEIQPDKWGDGYSLSSLIHISKECPPGHQIKFLASYEVKDWMKIRRDVTWGTFTITIGDLKSQTSEKINPPVIAGNQADNSLTCKSQTVLFSELFDDPDVSSRGWYDNTKVVISTTEHIPGSKGSAEYHWLQGVTTPTSGGAMRRLFTPTDSVCIDFWINYSTNYTGSNKPYHPHEFQILTTEEDAMAGPAYTHLTAYIEQNEGIPMLALQDGMNIDLSNLKKDLTNITENRAVCGCNGTRTEERADFTDCYKASNNAYWNGKAWKADKVYFQTVPGKYYQNDWHHITAFFKLNTITGSKGNPDGVIRYWYNEQLIIERTNVMFRTALHPSMQFNQFMIAPYIGDGSPVDQTFWVDNLTISTGSNTSTGD